MKKGFTLFEILLVIVIISLIMTMIFWFGANRLQSLGTQTATQKFISHYTQLRQSLLGSSYLYQTSIDTVMVSFGVTEEAYSVWWYRDNDMVIDDILLFDGWWFVERILLNDTEVDTMSVILKPYELTCSFGDAYDTGTLLFTLAYPTQSSSYCFAISSQTCRLQETLCP